MVSQTLVKTIKLCQDYTSRASAFWRGAMTTPNSSSVGALTHYWDCCRPSCSWDQGQNVSRIANRSMCDARTADRLGSGSAGAKSSCDVHGAGAVMCPDQAPFFDSETHTWMGFVASPNGAFTDCCECYELSLEGGDTLTVQVTNHGDVHGALDLLVPGGGFGDFDGCSVIFPSAGNVAQDRFGGLHSPQDCSVAFRGWPRLVASCEWMFESGVFPYPAPGVSFAGSALISNMTSVVCPAALNQRSGCSATGLLPPPLPAWHWQGVQINPVLSGFYAVFCLLLGLARLLLHQRVPRVLAALTTFLAVSGAFFYAGVAGGLSTGPAFGLGVGLGAPAAPLAALPSIRRVAECCAIGAVLLGLLLRTLVRHRPSRTRPRDRTPDVFRSPLPAPPPSRLSWHLSGTRRLRRCEARRARHSWG